MVESTTTVRVIEGLHTRPAAHIAQIAKGFDCRVELVCRGAVANVKSSVKLMLLGVKEGEEVTLRADGSDETTALERLLATLQTPELGLAEGAPAANPQATEPAPVSTESTEAGLRGVAGSRGTALGPAFVVRAQALTARRQVIEPEEVDAELDRFRRTLAAVLQRMHDEARTGAGQQERAILQALGEVAQDEEYVGAIVRGIEARGDAAAVTLRVGQLLSESFAAMADAYMRARAEDIRGVTRQLAAALLDQPLQDLSAIREPAVVLAHDLSAWEFAQLPLERVLGLVCSAGSATSHVAIMARTYGIPAVLGVALTDDDMARVRSVGLDGHHGIVMLDPDAQQAGRLRARIAAEAESRRELAAYRDVEPRTRDGRLVHVAANLGSLDEIALAQAAGAHGVGLFRTELLFMQRAALPSEDEQAEAYLRLAKAFAPQPVVIRTLDIGGDKPLAGIDFPREENPFLGWRGVRMCLDRHDIFKPQLRALLRAAVAGNLKVMVPMISCVSELREVRRLVAECAAELAREDRSHAPFELGVMVETPAAVLQAEVLAAESAFFSIGTNDLTQYVMATDRGNPHIAALYRTEHAAVLRAIEMACEAAGRAGIPVGICGEAAAQPKLIARFIAMGVTELSMSPASILAAKKRISDL
jgi:phosphocarrier protein FPr